MLLLARIQNGEKLISDGAMGTMLQEAGLKPGECPEQWCLTQPEKVMAIHRAYLAAGCNILETNSFGASSYKLGHFGLQDQVEEINRAAAALARSVAGTAAYVLGSLGPTGEFLDPYGDETEEDFAATFSKQLRGLEQGGADIVIVETMSSVDEAAVAVRTARAETNLLVVASFTFDPRPGGGYATMMGLSPAEAVIRMKEAGAHLVGANCGTGPEDMLEIIKQMRAADASLPLMALPNAGMPVVENGRTVFRETPQEMAPKSMALFAAGASIVGGCCGTTPAHLAALSELFSSNPA